MFGFKFFRHQPDLRDTTALLGVTFCWHFTASFIDKLLLRI